MTMQPWLRRMLIQSGRLTESGVSRRARIIIHRPCGIPCLAGLSDDICATEMWAELQPINTQGEAEALLAGRQTIDYWTTTSKFWTRWPENIAHHPAGTQDRILQFAEHRCDTLMPTTWADTRTTNTVTIRHDEEPNY